MADSTDPSKHLPSKYYGPTIEVMKNFLINGMNATDEELTYLREILDLRSKSREAIRDRRSYDGLPSLVLDDFLYHGDLGHACNMKLLNELDIKHIIDVCDCELDKEIVGNFHVLWINLNDELRVDIQQHFEESNQFLYECKQKNEKVLVHCQMGISRSSTIVLAYLMKFHHDSLLKAYDFLLDRRPIAAPNYGFFLQLIRYERQLCEKKEIDEQKGNDDKSNPIKQLDPVVSKDNTEEQKILEH